MSFELLSFRDLGIQLSCVTWAREVASVSQNCFFLFFFFLFSEIGIHSVAQARVQWCSHGSLQSQTPRLK